MPEPTNPYTEPAPQDRGWQPYLEKAVNEQHPHGSVPSASTHHTDPTSDYGYPAQGYSRPGDTQAGFPPPDYQPSGFPQTGYPGYPGYAPPPATNGLAIAALITGIVGWTVIPIFASIAAIVLGHMARAQIRQTGEPGNGMAVAGLVLGYTVFVPVVVFFAVMVVLLTVS